MLVSVLPSVINGIIQAPASKSSMQRACAAALLSHGRSVIKNAGNSNDDLAALDVIVKLGAKVSSLRDGSVIIESQGVQPRSTSINCGESGLGVRMFTPLAALCNEVIEITGSGSLLKRPMHFFDSIFPLLGIEISSKAGHLPLQIKGPLVPADIGIDGSLSSQFLTGLLMAYGAAGAQNVTIRVQDLKSKPYIDLTLDVMKHFGVEVENDDYETFRFIADGHKGFTAQTYTVEGDWSGAAFLLVAGAISGNITVKGLSNQSSQADKKIMEALYNSGAAVGEKDDEIQTAASVLKAFQFDATDCPDLFPPLVALASYCHGTTVIKGVNRLTHKESNRALTLQQEFGKMGIAIRLDDDTMVITGGTGIKGAKVHSNHDHRIAMACAVAGLHANGETTIENAEAIDKSYRGFYEDLRSLNASVSLRHEAISP